LKEERKGLVFLIDLDKFLFSIYYYLIFCCLYIPIKILPDIIKIEVRKISMMDLLSIILYFKKITHNIVNKLIDNNPIIFF
jgi:hypothetical protein